MSTLHGLFPKVSYLGRCHYYFVLKKMQQFTQQRLLNTRDEIWILEHSPVYTLGQSGTLADLIKTNDIPIVYTDRGGQMSYHGPGQLIIYFLMNLRNLKCTIRQFVESLEQTVIKLLADYGIKANGNRKAPGVYIEKAKIASIGLRIRNGCCYHGLSFNATTELSPFYAIRTCGFDKLQITRLSDWIDTIDLQLICDQFLAHWNQQSFYQIS